MKRNNRHYINESRDEDERTDYINSASCTAEEYDRLLDLLADKFGEENIVIRGDNNRHTKVYLKEGLRLRHLFSWDADDYLRAGEGDIRFDEYRMDRIFGGDFRGVMQFKEDQRDEDWDDEEEYDDWEDDLDEPYGRGILRISKGPGVDESHSPVRNSRRRRKLDESIDYGSLSQRDQQKMDRLVENLRGAKETLESLCYRGDVEDDETRGELLDMHIAVCKMLDRLPW
jgi:hypothetical protein